MTKLESRRCYVYDGVVDLRKGADGLRALVGKTKIEVLSVFSNRSRALLKFLSVDKTGVWCGTIRLHHGSFVWPESPGGRQRLTRDELACLLSGGDVKKRRLRQTLSPIEVGFPTVSIYCLRYWNRSDCRMKTSSSKVI